MTRKDFEYYVPSAVMPDDTLFERIAEQLVEGMECVLVWEYLLVGLFQHGQGVLRGHVRVILAVLHLDVHDLTERVGRVFEKQADHEVRGCQPKAAELYVQDASGKRLSREPWTVKYADSENENGNHLGDKVFDLQESTFWQTERNAALPHLLVIDLGSEQTVSALEYLPRAEEGAPGSVKDFKIYLY